MEPTKKLFLPGRGGRWGRPPPGRLSGPTPGAGRWAPCGHLPERGSDALGNAQLQRQVHPQRLLRLLLRRMLLLLLLMLLLRMLRMLRRPRGLPTDGGRGPGAYRVEFRVI